MVLTLTAEACGDAGVNHAARPELSKDSRGALLWRAAANHPDETAHRRAGSVR